MGEDSFGETGLKLAMLGRLKEAVESFQQAEAQGVGSSPMLYYNWGLALSHLGNHGEAIEKYRRAIALDSACVMRW